MGRKRRGGGEERPATIIFFLDSSELCVEGFGTEGVLNIAAAGGIPAVSYTHLRVYCLKRIRANKKVSGLTAISKNILCAA